MKSILIIIPAHNEEENIVPIYSEMKKVIEPLSAQYLFEILFVNDGSHDKTILEIEKISKNDDSVKLIDFSRNFGKEAATSAGINDCKADACIILDADMQHPVELIPEFIEKWEQGNEVVIGVRRKNKSDSIVKKIGSNLFYKILNSISEVEIVPRSTDYRLIDQVVIGEFKRLTEKNRMTRALIDWLGFRRDYIYFDANARINGTASYSFIKLFNLALNSFISLSLVPLKFASYIGIFITLFSGITGFYILLGKYFFHLPFASTFSDSENLAIFIVFLVGIILISIGLLAMYMANIHSEVINRPMYVVRKKSL